VSVSVSVPVPAVPPLIRARTKRALRIAIQSGCLCWSVLLYRDCACHLGTLTDGALADGAFADGALADGVGRSFQPGRWAILPTWPGLLVAFGLRSCSRGAGSLVLGGEYGLR
jgi:hypothetical protein